MAWTTPTTQTTGTLITASIWNTDITDNLSALKAPPSAQYTLNEGANYTTTSTTFVDVDSTNLSLSVTTTGGVLEVGFFGAIECSATAQTFFDVTIDGTRVGGDDGLIVENAGATSEVVSFVVRKTGVSAGAHTVKLQWKTASGTMTLYAGAGTSTKDIHPQFWAVER